jgi:hypothetical protein
MPDGKFYLKPDSGTQSVDDDELTEINVVSGGIIYKYRINIRVRNGNCKFLFTDEEGDTYSLTCIKSGWHYVDYNSGKPAIVKWERT